MDFATAIKVVLGGLATAGLGGDEGELDIDRIERARAACQLELDSAGSRGTGPMEHQEQAVAVAQSQIRQQLIPALRASSSPDDRFAAILWSWVPTPGEKEGRAASPADQLDALGELLQSRPEHVPALALAFLTCPKAQNHPLCSTGLADRIAEAEPDNGRSWLFVLDDRWQANDKGAALAALDKLAELPSAGYVQNFGWWAYQAAERRMSPLTATGQYGLAMSALTVALTAPLPRYQPLIEICGPEELVRRGPAHTGRCLAAGNQLAGSGESLLDKMVGYAIQEYVYESRQPRDVERIDALATERERLRERIHLLHSTNCDMLPTADGEYWSTFLRDLAEHGEARATENRLRRDLERWAPPVQPAQSRERDE